jgi:hypothetical protein
MKARTILRFSLTLPLIAMACSCSDFLDQVPEEKLSEDVLFESKDDAVRVLTQAYYSYPNPLWFGHNGIGSIEDVPSLAADEADYNWNNYSPYKKDMGQYSASSPIFKQWQRYYQAIQVSMYFIDHIDACNDAKLSDEEKRWWKGEAYFLEAAYYFLLLEMYGPVPILDRVYQPGEVAGLLDAGFPRATVDECVAHIDGLLEQAIERLDLFYTTSSTERAGRTSQAAARFLQSRLWLYAASPLYNGMVSPTTGKDYNYLNPEGGRLFPAYDATKWKKAFDVAAAAIRTAEEAGRMLYTHTDGTGYANLWRLFSHARGGEPNIENLFYRQNYSTGTTRTHSLPISWSGYSGICPTLEHVNEYFLSNGLLPEDDPAHRTLSITDVEEYENEGHTFTIPRKYAHRDPRFYINILFPGQYSYAILGNDSVSASTRWAYNTDKTYRDEVHFRPFYDEQDGFLKKTGRDYCNTGFLLCKFVGKSDNKTAKGDYAVSIYRLAELYLNYTEAAFELAVSEGRDPATDEAVFTYWDRIRQRAQLPPVRQAYAKAGIPLTVEKLRTLIRREREIELAFEGHRYFDNRRWLIAEREGGDKHGFDFEKTKTGGFWSERVFETRYWDDKMYFLPIPQTEIDKNPALTQNVGW